jgi:hypothetical protein
MKRILTALAFAASCGAASATTCESLTVNVLPFEVTEDHTWSVRQLTEAANKKGAGLVAVFGAVFASSAVAVQGCTVWVGYTKVILRVASELKDDECTFTHVRSHEQEHLRIYRTHLATVAERVQKHVALAGTEALGHALMDELASSKADHAALDSPTEYATNLTACNGNVLALAGLRRFN